MQTNKRYYYDLNLKEVTFNEEIEGLNNTSAGLSYESVVSSDKACIYALYCIPEGKFYVGSTNNIIERIRHHKRNLSQALWWAVSNSLLEAFDKYGFNSMLLIILEDCTKIKSVMKEVEDIWIKRLKPYGLYNIQPEAYKLKGGKSNAHPYRCVSITKQCLLEGKITFPEAVKRLNQLGYTLDLKVSNL